MIEFEPVCRYPSYDILVLDFVCPTCEAGVGQVCVRRRSRVGAPAYHKTRGRLVQRARR